jgi:hypothetical protein
MINKLPKLVGIHGHAGTGKDTVAAYLHQYFKDVYIEAFADPLKKACEQAFGIPLPYFHNPDFKEEVVPVWNTTPRKIAQFFGTEMFRETISALLGPEFSGQFWVRRLEGKLIGALKLEDEGDYAPDDIVVIPDVRFQNEYDWIMKNKGVVIHLTRPGKDGNIGIQNHASEAGIHHNVPERTYFINNTGSIGDLYNEVDRFVSTFTYLNFQRT